MESNFVKGVRLLERKCGALEYYFEHDIVYLNPIKDFDAYEINELFDLGFYIDNNNDCFIRYS